jgi:hypothetical protein
MTKLSTRELMRLVVLAACNMLLFRGIWWILKYPPVTLVVVILNLALIGTFVRPRSLNRAFIAAIWAGLFVVIAATTYLADARFRAVMASMILEAVPETLYKALPSSVRSASGIQLLDFAILDALGIVAMVLAAWLARPRRPARPGTPAS